jgi:hypothetical protein
LFESLERREMMAVDIMDAAQFATFGPQFEVCSVSSEFGPNGVASYPQSSLAGPSYGTGLQVGPLSLVPLDGSFSTARDLGSLHGRQRESEWVGWTDTADYYRFTLDDTANFTLSLDQLSADIDLYLFDATGREISNSRRSGNASEQIELSLSSGSYYALVAPWDLAMSNYRLSLEADLGGDSLGTARDLGIVEGLVELDDWAGAQDTNDYFRFVLDDPAEVTLRLGQLNRDLDLYIYDESGNELGRSWWGGNADELIQLELGPGTYYARVRPWGSAESNYHFSLNVDAAGNDFSAARNLGRAAGVQQITDWVGEFDANDYFRFELDERAEVSLRLGHLDSDIDLYLFDANGNQISGSWFGGNTDEVIQLNLGAGTYFALVTPWDAAESHYELTLDVDVAGEDIASARNLGMVNGHREFTDWVGQFDASDFFRFRLDGQADVSLRLDQLSSDIDLYLYDANGNLISRSWLGGNSDEAIDQTLTAGTYFIAVTPWYGNESSYHLSLDVDLADDGGGDDIEPLPDVPYFGGANDWNINAVNAPEAWARGFIGANVIVAVIDTGVDYSHFELAGNIWTNDDIAGNGIDDDGNGYIDDFYGWDFAYGDSNPMDVHGHGTHVAGTIAAANNGVGATGVAFGAMIMPVQVLDSDGYGSWDAVASGIRYAVDNGADIINLSLGGGYSSAIASALSYANDMGVFVAAAAGNDGESTPGYPAYHSGDFDNVLSVGAHDSDDSLAWFSNRVGDSGAVQIDAPGVDVYSTLPGNSYDSWSGTSMATPHVAGVAALVLGANPNLTPGQLRGLLVHGASRSIDGSDSVGGLNAAMSVAMALDTTAQAYGGENVATPPSGLQLANAMSIRAVDSFFEMNSNWVPARETGVRSAACQAHTLSLPDATEQALLTVSTTESIPSRTNSIEAAAADAAFESLWGDMELDLADLQLV